MRLVASIDAWLPQTQCRRCEYPDCLAYAEAIGRGDAAINRCPPGGDATINGLARLLGRPASPLDSGLPKFQGFRLARIVERECIGCTRCIQACPVDAIIGSGKKMHTVLESLCTGCELCIPPCPVDCIVLVQPAFTDRGNKNRWPEFPEESVSGFRNTRQRHVARTDRDRDNSESATAYVPYEKDKAAIRSEILAAVARSRKRRENVTF